MHIADEIQQGEFESEFQKLAINLLYTNSYFDTIYAQRLKPFNISPEQYNVMRILKGHYPKPMGVKAIQARMLNKMSNTSRLIDKLKQKNLVERVESSHDRRAVDITLTPSGLEQLDSLTKEIEGVYDQYKSLSETEAQHLNMLLDKLRGNARATPES